jgi:hypothetical protein
MIYDLGSLQWIDSAGGPLLLLSSGLFRKWNGVITEFARNGGYDWPYPDEPKEPETTDYDRACAITGYVGLVTVGGGQGLVLGDMPMSTAWAPLSTSEGILIRWMYGNDAAGLLSRLLPIAESIWKPAGVTFAAGEEPLYLFDSAAPGEDATERLTITLVPGEYAIDAAIARPDAHTEMALHPLRRL